MAGWTKRGARCALEVSMSSVVRSWLRAFCSCCEKKQVFELKPGWVLVCSQCGHEKRLDANGLLAL
jgi:hypothetical protein